jgi:hypothetical protein
VSGTVVGVSTIGAGSGLPLESTLDAVASISVMDRFDVVLTVSPLDSG